MLRVNFDELNFTVGYILYNYSTYVYCVIMLSFLFLVENNPNKREKHNFLKKALVKKP